MAIRSDSEVARRIVRSFIDFLGSVHLAPGVDPEALEVASQCLAQVFDLQSAEAGGPPVADDPNQIHQEAAQPPQETRDGSSVCTETAGEGVYTSFIEGLESAGFFAKESERAARLSQAKSTFEETLKAFKGQDESDLLAESFKAQGNVAMAARRYPEAVELYTLAISICGSNAIYFANRAAAHTQAGNVSAAMNDCYKAIEINPRYSKAYGRLGLVNYSQGRYFEAAEWFSKALELDPSNASAKESLEATQRKLEELHIDSWTPRGQSESVPGIVNVSAQFEPRRSDSETSNSPEFELENLTVNYEGGIPFVSAQQGQEQGSGRDERSAQEFASQLRSALQSVLGGQTQQ